MVEPSYDNLSIRVQCRLLSISRSGWYYDPKGEHPLNLKLMCLIDEQFLLTPYYGSRQMARHLRRQDYCVGRHRNAFDNGAQARQQIGAWLTHYNQTRPHSTFNGHTPDEMYNKTKIYEGHAPHNKKQAA